MNNEVLKSEYVRILDSLDPSYFDGDHAASKLTQGLSGLFLASVRPEYVNAKNKIMVVGRETRGWRVLKDIPFRGVADYVAEAVSRHREFFDRELGKKSASRGRSFHNFMRSVAQRSGGDGLVYANLFCFSWNKSTPARSPFFEEIKSVSEKLLKAQIRLLSPDLIIFACGMSSVVWRRQFFPIGGDQNCCLNSRDYVRDGISRHHLWEFDLYGKTRCLRVHHPSARSVQAEKARQFLFGLLPAA